jgi:hypothetical protein
MKTISGLAGFKQPSALTHKLVLVFALILTATLCFTGCSKKSATAQSSDASQTAAVPLAPDDLRQLNHAYIDWVMQNNRHAKTFEEYVAASGISAPTPPAGKKYIIDKKGFINYADK